MKKVTVDLLLGRNSKCHTRKITQKTTIIKAAFPVGQQKNTSIKYSISKYGLNTDEVY